MQVKVQLHAELHFFQLLASHSTDFIIFLIWIISNELLSFIKIKGSNLNFHIFRIN